ncbi:hypothetical protein AMATHDRAFT_6944 [Amanita thiersii Skay4041]|uniref:Uncharacterized protein n=1 Tax=Amanita thiersii Skay4041 TaxID=703135 RepID=A0A2A9N9J3_9AGAR|nr:hypothetical protein AMATHDRAFT_6944 [Amanita thiersii Skay4041]
MFRSVMAARKSRHPAPSNSRNTPAVPPPTTTPSGFGNTPAVPPAPKPASPPSSSVTKSAVDPFIRHSPARERTPMTSSNRKGKAPAQPKRADKPNTSSKSKDSSKKRLATQVQEPSRRSKRTRS